MNDATIRPRRRWLRALLAAFLAAGLAGTAPRPPRALAQTPAPQPSSFLDPENPELELLQRYGEATAGLPRDKRGEVDWMKALREERIRPRTSLRDERPMEVLKLDIIMRNTKEMPHVRFPHESHTMWLACTNCHDGIFVPKAGANPITMGSIFQGKYCGVCHDRVAFTTVFACERCHSLPHGDIKAWWTDGDVQEDKSLPQQLLSP